jgi:aminoglycoside phosphotransferase (APT) family kinase protein
VDKQFQLAGELTNLAAWAALVSQTYPELATLAQQSLDYLQQQAPGLPLATQTPIHKDFHYRHVLVGHGVKVIDFDELRLGDPNFDLAHFCANLRLLSYRQHGSPYHLRNLEQQFLDAYARYTGWTLTHHLAQFTYFYVYTCLKLARQLCLGFGPSPIPGGNERQRQVQMILSQGMAAIAMN